MKFFSTIFIALVLMGSVPQLVGAAPDSKSPPAPKQDDACSGEPKTVPCDPAHPEKGQCVKLCNPIESGTIDIKVILGGIIKFALGIVGSLTLLMLVWGGFLWLTSGGNPERVKKGTQTMLWATIGVILVFASYLIVRNFTEYLTTGKFFSPGKAAGQ